VVRAVPGARTVAEVWWGGRRVARERGGPTLRLRLPARAQRAGVYTVRVRATARGRTEHATLAARRR
jgi:hypothetical protein